MYVAAAVMDIVAVLPANEQLVLPAILVNQCCMILRVCLVGLWL